MTDPMVHLGRRRGRRSWQPVGYGLHRRLLPRDAAATQPDRTGLRELRADLLAWQVVLPAETVFTHLTAARVLGLWLPSMPDGLPVFASVPQGVQPPRRRELRVSRISRPLPPLVVAGVRVAPPAEILLACARDLGVLDLVLLLDCALRRGLVSSGQVAEVGRHGRPGSPTLRAALALADRRSESPWESVLRVFHVLCEVPVEPQHVIVDEWGVFVARADLWLRGTRTIHEYDGAVHRDRRTHVQDLARDRALANAGWTRRGYTARDLLREGEVMLREADTAIGRAHDRGRLEPWLTMLRASLFTSEVRARLSARWRVGTR